jgi:hypothetical protein
MAVKPKPDRPGYPSVRREPQMPPDATAPKPPPPKPVPMPKYSHLKDRLGHD